MSRTQTIKESVRPLKKSQRSPRSQIPQPSMNQEALHNPDISPYALKCASPDPLMPVWDFELNQAGS